MNLNKTENFAIDIANMAFADISQKKQIKEAIMREIALSCLHYSKNPKYKEEMDNYIQYLRMKMAYEPF